MRAARRQRPLLEQEDEQRLGEAGGATARIGRLGLRIGERLLHADYLLPATRAGLRSRACFRTIR